MEAADKLQASQCREWRKLWSTQARCNYVVNPADGTSSWQLPQDPQHARPAMKARGASGGSVRGLAEPVPGARLVWPGAARM
eukprot:1051716-Rhodomonas_salina.1